MSATTIETIYNEFRTNYENRPEFTIDLYTKNIIYFNNINSFKDSEDLGLFIELNWLYLNAIFKKNHYSEVIEFVEKKRPLIDKEINRLEMQNLKDGWYYGIVFFYGRSIYNLGQYKKATPLFKELVNSDNKNDTFNKWLRFSKYGEKIWLVNTIWAMSALLLLIPIFGDKYIPNPRIRMLLNLAGLAFLLSTFAYERFIKGSFRKTNLE